MKKTLIAVVAALAMGASAEVLELGLGMDGEVRVGHDGMKLGLSIHNEGWKSTSKGTRKDFRAPDEKTGTANVEFYNQGRLTARGKSQLLVQGRDAAYSAEIASTAEQRPEDVVLSLELPMSTIAGGTWKADGGKSGWFDPKWDGHAVSVFNGAVSSFTISPARRAAFSLVFPKPVRVMLQDNRTWGQSFTLRIHELEKTGSGFNSGDRRDFACKIVGADGTRVSIDHEVRIVEGDEWIPLDYCKDIEAGSALDFSQQGLHDAPAGKYGWLKNEKGHFVFEKRPGKTQRFYGVNLCFTACYPDHELADRLVTRLVRLGYNTVRIHHYERGAVQGSSDNLTLNAENLDRLDYLLAKCRENGIYITTDLFTSRPVSWRSIGIDRDGMVDQQVYKNMVLVHEPAFENWKEFSRRLLNHVNPYTKLAYKNDPALPLISLINEGALTWCWDRIKNEEPLRAKWKQWLAVRRAAKPDFAKGVSDDSAALRGWGNAPVLQFMADLERDFVKRATKFMKEELGAKALLTNQNCGGGDPDMMSVRRECYEYVDSHFYVDHPQFLVKSWSLPSKCGNGNPVQANRLAPVAVANVRLPEQPFTITEWNFSGPGMYRGVGGIMTGAVAALQDWDGLWRFAYSHSVDGLQDGKGTPGYFDVGTDPLGQAGDRASVCLFLRGDLPASGMGAKVETSQALRIDRERGTLSLDTERTAGGFTPSGRLASGAVAFDCGQVATTLWASSLDGRPISTSKRILVSHLTDVQANGNRYADPDKKILLKWGGLPPLVRNGQAKVELALARPQDYAIWALATTGRRLERIPSKVVDGKLVFTANVRGPNGARMLYEIATAAFQGPLEAPGFFVRDVAANGEFQPFDASALGMTFKQNVRKAGNATCFDLTLTDTTGRDRALTLLYAIPIEAKSEWLANLRTRSPLKGEHMDVTAPPCGMAALSRWPFGAVDAAGRGQALGIDPTAPAFFRVVADANRRCLYIAFDLGFAKEHPAAHFGFCSFAFDGTLGFRGALERYQQLFPEANRVRVAHQGVWMPFYPISKVKGWEDFGFRFKEGGNEVAWDDAHGILTFNYTEPCTWWMRIPGGVKRGMTLAQAAQSAERLAAEGKDHYAMGWRKSAFRDANGGRVGLLRNEPWCSGAVWSVNSAPGIAGGDWSAKHGAFSQRYAGTFPQGLDGEYVDSAELYVTATLDYNRSHFSAMTTPLVFSGKGAKVGIFKGFIAYEYVRALAERVWPKGRFMMANYTPVSWCWLVPYLDVLGTETDWNPGSGKKPSNWRPMSDSALLYRRALCGGKPYCFIMDTAFERFPSAFTEKFMQRSLAYGMFPGFFSANGSTGHYFSRPELYERDRPLFKKYIPLCRKVAEAGWRPVNRLVATDAPRMVVEQFGTVPGARYVTVFNLEGQARTIRFNRLAKDATAEVTPELVTGVPWRWQNNACTVEIPGETVRVLQM